MKLCRNLFDMIRAKKEDYMKYLQHLFSEQTVKHYMKISHLELPMLPEIERKFQRLYKKIKEYKEVEI